MSIERHPQRNPNEDRPNMTHAAQFWDDIAPKYAASPVKDPGAYAHTLERTRSYLNGTDRVLEVGCGTGTTALKLAPFVAHLTATDFAPGMIDIARGKADASGTKNVTFEVAEAEAAAATNTFDAVIGFNLLHLVRDLPDTVAALGRQIRPGGYLITKSTCLGGIYSPLALMILVMRAMGKAPYVNIFTAHRLESVIAAAGFEIVETGDFPARPPAHFIVARKL